jgi:hypothetical protein
MLRDKSGKRAIRPVYWKLELLLGEIKKDINKLKVTFCTRNRIHNTLKTNCSENDLHIQLNPNQNPGKHIVEINKSILKFICNEKSPE